ncbi:MAG TPA: BatD family protein [Ferruginibacter sp.]|nr:BatD family protein [Ferruginibacter sp.]
MHSFLQKIAFPFLLLTGFFAGAQVKFTASISPAQIGKDEYAQLRLMVENAQVVQRIIPPRLNNFIIVSGPNQESGMSMVNGNVKKFVALSYVIKPKRVGSFSIPPASASADGAAYKSNAVTLKVTSVSSGNPGINPLSSPFGSIDPFADAPPESTYRDYILRKGEIPTEKIKKNMFVKLEVDKTSCFVGEPVIATYKLYTRLRSVSNMTKNPSFNGFSVIDMQQADNMYSRTEKLGGREYNVYNIRQVQLYPLLPGNLDLGVAEIENDVQFIKAEYADQQGNLLGQMFRDFSNAAIPPEGMENRKVILQNKPVSILVKPLPEANKPAGFKGAVGNFQITAAIEKNNFTTDDAGKLGVVIKGVGNLQMVTAPEINWPEGIEGYEPKTIDDLYKNVTPVSGRKMIEFTFTVAKPGKYDIPALEFSFFDTKDGKYKTVATRPVGFTVTKGSGKPQQIDTTQNKTAKEPLLTRFFSNRWRVVSLIAVLIILGLIFWLKSDNKKEKKLREQEEAEKLAAVNEPVDEIIHGQENPLAAAEESLQRKDGKAFYLTLNQDLKNYLSHKLSIPLEELNKKNISERLDKKGVINETSLQLHALMDEIEWQLYTPFTENEKMKETYEKAYDLVQLLNTYRS